MNKEDIIEAVANMSVMDLSDLVKMCEEKFGVSAAVATVAGGGVAAPVEEKSIFDVVLQAEYSNKIAAIKVVREVTGAALGQAKEIVESAPSVIKESISKEDAEEIQKKFEAAGAKVVLN